MKNMRKNHEEDSWDNRELGAEEKYVRKVSPDREKDIDEKLGLQIISIRLQKNLIDELKSLSYENGIGYQPYIRQILTQYVKTKRTKHLKEL